MTARKSIAKAKTALTAVKTERLLAELRELIFATRSQVAQAVNAALTALYWQVGDRIRREILKEKRAEYGAEIVSALGRQLETEFGRGFSEKSLRHMLRFAEVFPDWEIVSTLSRQLAWSHFLEIIYLKDNLQRDFYAEMCRLERWSVRTLRSVSAQTEARDFAEVVELIQTARQRAFAAVNTALIDLYWQVGQYLSRKLETAEWGEGVVERLAQHIASRHLDIKGFTRRNLFRMRQFYETYRDDEKVVSLIRQLPWTHNLLILSRCKLPEEREFYLRLCLQERWGKRELERQLSGALFGRTILYPPKVSPLVTQLHPGADFAFVGEQVRLQVGGRDFILDLLFFHRVLCCLVAFEVKITEFQPEHLGKLEFYLEALDRDLRKPSEGPSIGVLLCATKDSEVVEYALSRTLSPALVAEYQTKLPDKKLLRAKLHEFYALSQAAAALKAEADALPIAQKTKRKPKGGAR